jgi:adenylate cyclase class IV
MGRNIEVKMRLGAEDSIERLGTLLEGLPREELQQEDTFFQVARGRLKLRAFDESSGELILYERANNEEPKISSYSIARTGDPIVLLHILSSVLPVVGVVRKKRIVFFKGQTRIHLDRVEDLGCFLELEVVLSDEQSEAEGRVIAEGLLDELRLDRSQSVSEAYIDLLTRRCR